VTPGRGGAADGEPRFYAVQFPHRHGRIAGGKSLREYEINLMKSHRSGRESHKQDRRFANRIRIRQPDAVVNGQADLVNVMWTRDVRLGHVRQR
jgi:hypothetical protein